MPSSTGKWLFAVLSCVIAARSKESTPRVSLECQKTLNPLLGNAMVASEELLEICRKHYPEGICSAARSNLDALPHVEFQERGASPRKATAEEACAAVEAAWSFRKALLLRQMQPKTSKSNGDDDKAAGDDKAAAEDKAAGDNATQENVENITFDKMDSSLQDKWTPVPHGRFTWEYKSKNFSDIDRLVYRDEAVGVNITDPRVIERADAFEKYVTTSKPTASGEKSDAKESDSKDTDAAKSDKKESDKKESFMQFSSKAEAEAASPDSMHRFGEALRKAVSESLRKKMLVRQQAIVAHKPPQHRGGAAFLQASRVSQAVHSQEASPAQPPSPKRVASAYAWS